MLWLSPQAIFLTFILRKDSIGVGMTTSEHLLKYISSFRNKWLVELGCSIPNWFRSFTPHTNI